MSGSVHEGDLLIAWSKTIRKAQPMLLPFVDDDPLAKLVRRLLSSNRLRVRILRPPADLSAEAAAAWHTDAWIALPEAARKRGAVVAGPTANQLTGVSARVVCVVTPPDKVGLRPKHMSELLRSKDPRHVEMLAAAINRKSRLLLPNADKLGDGRTFSPEKLRKALRRIELVPIDRLPELAADIAQVLGLDPVAARDEADEILDRYREGTSLQGLPSPDVEKFLDLNRLDASLWELAQSEVEQA